MMFLLSFLFIGLTTASTVHYSPLILTTTQQLHQPQQQQLHQPQQQQLQDQQPSTTQYHDQDNQGFYSYGYSGESSAKAEYKSIDGTSKGFYSYVDANGELQTVEYVAGRELGFQAVGTHLPKAPIDNRRGPAPVRDTPEVQMAKKAHFEAYREAELRASLASGDVHGKVHDRNAEEQETILRQTHEQEQEQQERRGGEEDNRHGNDNGLNLSEDDNDSRQGADDMMTSYRINTQLSTVSNSHVNSRLSTTDQRLAYVQPASTTTTYTEVHPASVQVRPVNSYYTVSAPATTTHYLSSSAPISQIHSTFVTQQLEAKK